MLHLWLFFPSCKGLIQAVPQPAAKQRRLDDDEIDAQGTYCIIEYLHLQLVMFREFLMLYN